MSRRPVAFAGSRSNGASDCPSSPFGGSTPHSSVSVGKRSINPTGWSQREPAGAKSLAWLFGGAMIKGTRVERSQPVHFPPMFLLAQTPSHNLSPRTWLSMSRSLATVRTQPLAFNPDKTNASLSRHLPGQNQRHHGKLTRILKYPCFLGSPISKATVLALLLAGSERTTSHLPSNRSLYSS